VANEKNADRISVWYAAEIEKDLANRESLLMAAPIVMRLEPCVERFVIGGQSSFADVQECFFSMWSGYFPSLSEV